MNKKILIILSILIIIIAGFTGCFEAKTTKKKSGPSYKETPGEYPSESGWLDSDMSDNSPQHLDTSLPLDINITTKITVISIMMRFEDSDSAHSESDQGSDPDEVTITLSNGNNETTPATGETPCNLEVQMNITEDGQFITGDWQVNVVATCNGGKPYTLIPRPGYIAPIVYKDQGIAYTLDTSYTFLKVS